MSNPGEAILEWIDRKSGDLIELSDRIWEYAEVGLHETRSARVLEDFLRDEGFEIESGVAGMPTAFKASWGSGRPVIGFLGEYDALPGVSQKTLPVKDPLRPGAPGHGCGHNLLGVGGLAAAAALRHELETRGLGGTVRYYGCPAEETLVGKVFMVKEGLFEDVDAVLDWHPGHINAVGNTTSNAMNSVKFRFYGITSHAASDPQNGRSALDAVELMNTGANYLREHVIDKARIHYVITCGGEEPNVVPAFSEVWYYVRAPERYQVEDIHERIMDIARGAALMTGTTFDAQFLSGCYSCLPNTVFNRILHRSMEEVGAVDWTEEELEFAREISSSFRPRQKEAALKALKAPKETYEQTLHQGVFPFSEDETIHAGSTDVGDVSWVVPTGRIRVACGALGQPGHSWQFAACSGMSIGHKGMLMAAKVLAGAGLELATSPETVAKAKAEWAERTREQPYKSPIPEGVQPPFDQLHGVH